MELTTRIEDGAAVIDLGGQVRGVEIERSVLNSKIDSLLSNGQTLIVLNCDGIEFIDEMGAVMLFKAYRYIRESGGYVAIVRSDYGRGIFGDPVPDSKKIIFSEEPRAIAALKKEITN